MPDTTTLTLPVLPLEAGVVGPGMVVTIAVESDEARIAADQALGTDGTGRLLLVPRVDGRFATVGTIAKIEDVGDLPGGRRALVVRGITRAVIGGGVAGEGLWVEAEPVAEAAPPSDETHALVREYRATMEAILDRRGAGRLAEGLRGIRDPGAIADTAFYSPDLSLEQKVELLEAVDVETRLRLALQWAKDTLADLSVRDDIDRSVADK